jgi:hypothetical protein
MPAAVEIEHDAAAEGRGSNDGECFDPVEVNVCRLRAPWRRRHQTLEECVLSAQCFEGGRGTNLTLDEPAQPQAHDLGAQTHRGPAALRCISARRSLPRLLPVSAGHMKKPDLLRMRLVEYTDRFGSGLQ